MTTEHKRAGIVFFAICFLFAVIIAHLYRASAGNVVHVRPNTVVENAKTNTSSESAQAVAGYMRTVTIAKKRGDIYDCNMESLVKSEGWHKLLIQCGRAESRASLLEFFTAFTDLDAETCDKYASRRTPVVTNVKAGTDITELKRVMPKYVSIFATDGRSTMIGKVSHYLGYTRNDTKTNTVNVLRGVSGVEKIFDEYLSDCGEISIKYPSDALGAPFLSYNEEVFSMEYYDNKKGVMLTIDKRIQEIAESVVSEVGLHGAVVVCDVVSGEIRAMVSAPSFEAERVSEYFNAVNGELMNKCLSAYNLGSVFKIAVAAAALDLDSDLYERKFNCEGYTTVHGQRFACHNKNGHGVLGMYEAMEKSCNIYFINLAREIGAEPIIKTAKTMGFGEKICLTEGYYADAGYIADKVTLPAAVANLSIGQGDMMVTPLQVAEMINTIGRGGKYRGLSMVKALVNSDGSVDKYGGELEYKQVIKPETAAKIVKMMTAVIESGSGMLAKPSSVSAAGKTASAETGIMRKKEEIKTTEAIDEKEEGTINMTWFAGFFPADRPRYSIVVLAEDGESGGKSSAPIFKMITDRVVNLK